MEMTPGRRPIHNSGIVFRGVFRSAAVSPFLRGCEVFESDRPRPALVRVSQAFGGLPIDFIGLAVQLPDAYGPGLHQDFILVSSPQVPILRRLPLPAMSVFSTTFFSSGTSYLAGGQKFLLGAAFRGAGLQPWLPLLACTDQVSPTVALLMSTPHGSWQLVGEIVLLDQWGGPDSALRFSPAVCGGGITSVGSVNWARCLIYRHFQGPRTIGKQGALDATVPA